MAQPETDIYADLRRWAQIHGKALDDLRCEAWNEWVVAHSEQILSELGAIRTDAPSRGRFGA